MQKPRRRVNRFHTKCKKHRLQAAERLEDRYLLAATPVGYWSFDDAGNLGADTTDNANDLASFGGVSFSQDGVTGGALSLDGTGYLGGIDPIGLPVNREHFTIAAWIKPTATGQKGIVGWGDFGGFFSETSLGLVETNGLRHDWGLVNLRANSSVVTGAGVDLDDGQWHHVAATDDGTERALWLDGEKLTSAGTIVHNVENENFRIGSSCVGCVDQLFDGLLDDVVIYNVGLDANQVASLYNGTSPLELREAGLISQWIADDLTANVNDGDAVAIWTENVLGASATANGTVTLETAELNGHAVVRFNPSDGPDQLRITAADNPLSGVADFSVAIVFRAASAGAGDDTGWEDNTGLIDASQLGTTNDWGLALNRDGQVGGGIGGPDVTAYSPSGANFANGQPHVAVFTRSGGTTSLYVDDFSPVTRSDAGSSLRGVFDVTIGSLQSNDNYFNGDIAEIQLYNKSLAGSEAVALAEQLVTKYGIEPPDVPIRIAGELLVDLRATDPSGDEATWRNGGTLGDFRRIGNPFTEVIAGVTAVSLNSDNPSTGWDDAYAGPLAPANITGNGTRSIEVWAYNPNDGRQNAEETAVAWGRRGGPGGSNLTFGYGNHGTWGAVGHWGTPDMPWFPGGGSPTLGQWHHLVYTFDGSTARVYADGQLANSESVGILGTHANTTINLAAQNGGGGILSLTEGQAGSLSLANVRVHTGVLSDADIAGNFAAGIQLAGDPPDPLPDGYSVTEDQQLTVTAANGVLSNDTDPNMLTLSAILEDAPENGGLVLGIDGSFTYSPNVNFNGTDSFTYRASNGDVISDAVTVTLNVRPRYDPAVAVPDNYVVDVNQVFSANASLGILANDTNVDVLSLSAILVTDSTAGQLTLNNDGSFTYDSLGVRGSQTFSYRIDDSVGQSNIVNVTLLVDTPPVATVDDYAVDEDRLLVISAANGVLRNDTDAELDPLTTVLVTDVQHGELTLRANGSFDYQPTADFFGQDSFEYHANDGDQISANVIVTLAVNAVNDAPIAVDDTFFGFEDELLIRGTVQGVLANDIDVDGPSLTAILVDGPAEGDLTLNTDGSFSYTPVAGFLGTQSFTYKVTDSLDESSIATATLLINSLDQQIVINEINYDPPDNTIPTEFIELYNAGVSPVDLSSWFFSDGISFTIPNGVVMQPETFLTVGADPDTLAAEFGIAALGPWDGTLTNDGEEVVLRNALADVVDRVDYGVAFPWPTAAAGDGSSMELIHPTLDNDLGGSWRSSTAASSLPAVQQTILGAADTNWRYRKGTSEASDPSDAWRQTGFVEDATWLTGQTPIGYGDGDDNTTLVDMMGNYTTVYLRHAFELDEVPEALKLRVYFDDGAIVWINGVEVDRFSVTAGEKAFNATAISHERAWESRLYTNLQNVLVRGTNTLAIHGINQAIGSSDLSIDAEIIIPAASELPSLPSPGAQNSVFALNAPPQSRQADHSPNAPTSTEDVVVTLKVSDPDGVGNVNLQYQIVPPGQYIPAFLPVPISTLLQNADTPPDPNPAYFDQANWTTVAMVDNGVGADGRAGDSTYTATIPARDHRTLVRYRMTVEDSLGASVRVPYGDDPSLNFAYFVYDGVPTYQTNQGTFESDMLETLPVYQFITRREDMTEVLAYNSADQIAQGPDARFTYNWPGTMVYDGEVYDNIKYRLRGANGRYHAAGKRSMRFRFNKGNYFQALDQDGERYARKWRTLTTGKGFDNRGTLTWGLNEALSLHLYNQIGLPASDTHWVHFRVIDEATESPDQWRGDFWGLNFIVETYDVRLLEAHGLEKGNLYKLINSRRDAESQQRFQAPDAVSDGADHDNIEANLIGSQTAEWLDAHVNLEKYYLHHALGEAIRHYDFWPDANKNMVYYFEPDYTQANNDLGKLWLLPWDTDASWGPTWNNGHDVVYNGIFPASGGGSDGNSTPELWPDYFNVVREIRDLLWQPDQIEPLIDEFASVIDSFEKADRARWRNAPSDAGNYNGIGGAGSTSLAALVQDMKNFAFVGGNWPGGGVGAGGRAAFLDSLQGSRGEANEIPFTPSISYVGNLEFATNGLAFRTTTFADPQGANTFAAMEWRLAKVTDPNAPAYDPNDKFLLEWHADWESGELTALNETINVPKGVVDVGHTYRARVRMQDTSGRWSHWSDPIEFTTTAPDNTQLLKDHLRVSEVHFNPLGPTRAEIIAGFDNNDDFEFIEVINTSATDELDLAGARFVDGIEFEFAASSVTSLAPGERAVIVEDLAAFELRYGNDFSIAGQWNGALSNGGEMLVLAAPDDSPILEFTFAANDDWPARANGDGSSLYVVALDGDYTDPMNWRASTAIHGTPGATAAVSLGGVVINEILAHTDPPVLDAIELYNPTAESVDVSGWFLSDSNADTDALAKFQIPAGTVLAAGDYVVFDENDFNAGGGQNPNDFAFSSTGDEAWLTAGTEFRPLFFADNISFGGTPTGETFGRVPNGMGLFAPQHRATLGCTNSVPRVGPLIISELMYTPAEPTMAELAIEPALDTEDFEFVEIFNPTDANVDLGGWELAGGVDFVFPVGVTLNSNSALVVLRFNPGIPSNAGKLQAFESRYGVVIAGNGYVGGYGGRLSDVGERVELRRFTADLVEDFHVLDDGVIYDTEAPWPADVGLNNQSIQRIAPVYWGSAPTSWNAANAAPGTASFRIDVAGDVTGDGQVTVDDVDVLFAVAQTGSTVSFYDVDNGGAVNQADALFVVRNILNTQPGDANLDGVVDGSDFNIWNNNKFQTCGKSWRHGDFMGDGLVDGSDFNVWFGNRFSGMPQAAAVDDRAPRAAVPAQNVVRSKAILPIPIGSIAVRQAKTDREATAIHAGPSLSKPDRPHTELIDARLSTWSTRSSMRGRLSIGEGLTLPSNVKLEDLDTVDEALRLWER